MADEKAILTNNSGVQDNQLKPVITTQPGVDNTDVVNQRKTLTPEELHDMVMDQQEKFVSQEKTIADLQLKLAQRQGTHINESVEKSTPVIPTNHVKHQGKAYRWNLAHFVLPGVSVVYTAEEAAQSEELVAEILKIEGQGILKELV